MGPLHPDELGLVHAFCSMEDSINLSLAGTNISPKVLAGSIANASFANITDFVTHVRERFATDPDISQNMIRMFFQHASESQQEHFFLS